MYVYSLTFHNCVCHTNSIYLRKLQVNIVTNIKVIRQNVFSYASVMVIGVSSDLKIDKIITNTTSSWIIFTLKVILLDFQNLVRFSFSLLDIRA